MISNNGTDIFRYWGEARVSGSADSATCSPGMERLFAFPLLSVKRKPTWNTAGCGSIPKREISPRNWGGTRMKSTGIYSPEALFTDARRACVVLTFFFFFFFLSRDSEFPRSSHDSAATAFRREEADVPETRAESRAARIRWNNNIRRSFVRSIVGG